MFESSWPQMDVAVVAGGELEAPCLGRLASFEKVIAVDGGLRHFKGVYPWVIVGDFDSATKEDLDRFAEVERVRYPQEKDQSDTDLALEYAFRHGASRVELFGALGGAFEHTLANLFLLIKFGEKLSIETESQTLYAISDTKKEASWPGRRLSLFPLGGAATDVVTIGLKWNLDHQTLDQSFYSLSNVAVGDSFEVKVGSGALICVLQNA